MFVNIFEGFVIRSRQFSRISLFNFQINLFGLRMLHVFVLKSRKLITHLKSTVHQALNLPNSSSSSWKEKIYSPSINSFKCLPTLKCPIKSAETECLTPSDKPSKKSPSLNSTSTSARLRKATTSATYKQKIKFTWKSLCWVTTTFKLFPTQWTWSSPSCQPWNTWDPNPSWTKSSKPFQISRIQMNFQRSSKDQQFSWL